MAYGRNFSNGPKTKSKKSSPENAMAERVKARLKEGSLQRDWSGVDITVRPRKSD